MSVMERKLLTISIVTYRLDASMFAQALRHLYVAVSHLAQHSLAQNRTATVRLSIIDNGADADMLRELVNRSGLADMADIISTGRNRVIDPSMTDASNSLPSSRSWLK